MFLCLHRVSQQRVVFFFNPSWYGGRIVVIVFQFLSHVQLSAAPWTAAGQSSLSFTISQSLLISCPSSQWCHPTISSPVVPFSCLQCLPASRSFPMSRLLASGGQSVGASASVLPIQDWFPLGVTGWISLQSKRLSRVFSSTTVWRHQFFGIQPSLWSSSHVGTWLLEMEGQKVSFPFNN